MKTATLGDIVRKLEDLIIAVHGSPDVELDGVASLMESGKGKLCFARKDANALLNLASDSRPAAVIVPADFQYAPFSDSGITFLLSPNPRLAFMRIVKEFFEPKLAFKGIHISAVIDEGVTMHPSATIGAHSYVASGTTIGKGTVIFPNVSICCPAKIGDNVKIHSGTVIGADGFGYERNQDGELEAFPHVGGVVIEDDVEIGANTCIDRGTLGNTIICKGARIDNLVHVAHNVKVGANSAVIANSMLGGSVDIGEGAWIAPSATLLNKLKIGARSTVGIGALVTKDVGDGEVVLGAPAMAIEQFKKLRQALARLIS